MKRGWKLAAVILFCLGIAGFAPAAKAASVQPPDKPIVQFDLGDFWTGGWFDNAAPACASGQTPDSGCRDTNLYPTTSCSVVSSRPNDSGSYYQSPKYDPGTGTYVPSASLYNGGVLTYNQKLSNGKYQGSSSRYGALSLGLIEGNAASNYGFSSGPTPTTNNGLSFANNANSTPNYWGGLLAGASPQGHCIPDYFYGKQQFPQDLKNGTKIKDLASGQYLFVRKTPNSVYTLNGGGGSSIRAGTNVTLFVKGDVYIDGDVSYPNLNNLKVPEIPHFALVVLGNIFVSAKVGELDGLYIAQPDQSSPSTINQTGVFWTCHDSSLSPPTNNYLFDDCNTKLTVNGAVIAKQANLLRTSDDISGPPAETFNYSLTNILSGPFFNTGSNGNNVRIDSLVNLPPVF